MDPYKELGLKKGRQKMKLKGLTVILLSKYHPDKCKSNDLSEKTSRGAL